MLDPLKAMVEVSTPVGIKHDAGKPRPSLLYQDLADTLQAVLEILEYGARKYEPRNWTLVEPERYLEAGLRHLTAMLRGEHLDSETGFPHLTHVITNFMFLHELSRPLQKVSKDQGT